MLAKVQSAAMYGIDAVPISVEVDITGGSPGWATVGLPENTVREARVRVQTAVNNSGFCFPIGKISINLAPANMKKEGTGFDLPIAVGIMAAEGMFSPTSVESSLFLGELSLDGEVKPVKGVLSAALTARNQNLKTIFVAEGNAQEAAMLGNVEVRSIRRFEDLIYYLREGNEDGVPKAERDESKLAIEYLDLRDVRGQLQARRALEIAAAGSHNLLFNGGPGAGKTMMAKRMPGILPPLTHEESIEVTRIHSAAGMTLGGELIRERPFRDPHHSTTRAGLVGGGNGVPRPGELSLASHGVLFLDELPEFSRYVLEVMRQPMESQEVTLSRANGSLNYPAKFMLVAAMNPCPCGYAGTRKCKCGQHDIQRYKNKISGPLLDRIDLQVDVPPVDIDSLEGKGEGEASEFVRNRVIQAREMQIARYGGKNNSNVNRTELVKFATPDEKGQRTLSRAVEKMGLSARSYDRMLRLSRTIADLDGSDGVKGIHVSEAVHYRGSQ